MTADYLLQRRIPVAAEYDVVIAGGGPAGTSAAISAARLGKRSLLLEATGALGGMGTNGLVSNWFSLSDGERILTKGLFWEVLCLAQDRGYLPPGTDVRSSAFQTFLRAGTGFNPEGIKIILDELCAQSGVTVRFCTKLIDADTTAGRINGVVIHNIEGYSYIPARTFIDATGDAVLANLCGVPCREAGRDTRGIMPPTLCALVANVDWSRFDYQGQQEIIGGAIEDGYFTQNDRHIPGLFRTGDTI